MQRASLILLVVLVAGCARPLGTVVVDPRNGIERTVHLADEPKVIVWIVALDREEPFGHHRVTVHNDDARGFAVQRIQLIGVEDPEPIDVWFSAPAGAYQFQNVVPPGRTIEFVTDFIPSGRAPESRRGTFRILLSDVVDDGQPVIPVDVPVGFGHAEF